MCFVKLCHVLACFVVLFRLKSDQCLSLQLFAFHFSGPVFIAQAPGLDSTTFYFSSVRVAASQFENSLRVAYTC